jgi:hypothetical protein
VFISPSAKRRPWACVSWRGTLSWGVFLPPKKNQTLMPQEFGSRNRSPTQKINAMNPITEMPTGTIEFKCIRINLKRISTFEPDERQIDSLIEFDLKIGDERLKDLRAEVRQLNGTDFQSQPLEVGNIIGYNGPWNYEEFRNFCERYYRDVIGSSGMGRAIHRGERNLIERIAIRLNRREEINLPSSAEKVMHANGGEQKNGHR